MRTGVNIIMYNFIELQCAVSYSSKKKKKNFCF